MSALFAEYDQDGDGGINFEEFEEITVRAIDAASSLRTDDDDDDGSGGTCGLQFCWILFLCAVQFRQMLEALVGVDLIQAVLISVFECNCQYDPIDFMCAMCAMCSTCSICF